ncbi:MAG: hypothetical protein GDA49_02405 [Rhodospirillales bacterium]|nr:hypothetical protein [Rhodospirillales bacterium]
MDTKAVSDGLGLNDPDIQQQFPAGGDMAVRTPVGPTMDGSAFQSMQAALSRAIDGDGTVTGGERVPEAGFPGACRVRPASAEMPLAQGIDFNIG